MRVLFTDDDELFPRHVVIGKPQAPVDEIDYSDKKYDVDIDSLSSQARLLRANMRNYCVGLTHEEILQELRNRTEVLDAHGARFIREVLHEIALGNW